jgi:hypothetical protein
METDLNIGIPVMELDELIRHTLQNYYLKIQPSPEVWGCLQHHLLYRKRGKNYRPTRGLQSDTTSTTTRSTDHG